MGKEKRKRIGEEGGAHRMPKGGLVRGGAHRHHEPPGRGSV
jgi:hypothetical protein